ncbi:MAG: dihydroorotate dehydrogenase electron transfer subunit [Coriobacteriia bacterium]|nr:dihydroorotate dehydrogenase electron transfer subunit [Coriobacteriia bacterium]
MCKDSLQQASKQKKVVCEARIVENSAVAPDTYALILDASELAELVQPGQFIELNLRQPDLVLPRPISAYRVHEAGEYGDGSYGPLLELRYQLMGEGTRRLSAMPAGTALGIFGPLGNRWPVPEDTKSALLVGGGIGSAPLAMLAQELVDAGCEVTMVQGGRNSDLLVAADLFETTCHKHALATDDGSKGHKGFVTGPLQELLEDADNDFDIAYICGPEPMQIACAALCEAAGLEAYVSLERMMACGIGACLTCVIPTSKGPRGVCCHGPIFNSKEVLWDEAKSARVH